ncbi:alpha-galactosidase A precursor [Aureobasidium pullulans]|uniref:Alpha-galactosidase A n=1 Tax=Aureobasidium pullulans TaxID=5580 RepID=A0A4S9L9T7_AURPU|nr:alpha-galactosidase A precursor [Aureobasidium pullulans]
MPDIRLLDASVDDETISDLRILIDSRHIKYITVDPGVYDIDTMCFEPFLIPALPPLPELPIEDWNSAHISHHPSNVKPHFSCVTNDPLPSIAQPWHPARVEFLDCQLGDKLRSNVHEATCPKFEGKVVVKLARFSWEIWQLDYETQAYQWIQGHGIAPVFLAHLTEGGRIIGFVMEHIANARHAGPEDLPLCQETLRRLHRLGIKHDDVNKHNILVRNSTAALIDFDNTLRGQEADVLNEFLSLDAELRDTSGRGGTIVESSG